jgi:hypothetical protein
VAGVKAPAWRARGVCLVHGAHRNPDVACECPVRPAKGNRRGRYRFNRKLAGRLREPRLEAR